MTKTAWRQIYEAAVAKTTVSGTIGSWRRRTAKALGYSGASGGLWSKRIANSITHPTALTGSFEKEMCLASGQSLSGAHSWPNRLIISTSLPTAT